MMRSLSVRAGLVLVCGLLLAACSSVRGQTNATEAAAPAGAPPPPNVVPAADASLFTVDRPDQFPLAVATERPTALDGGAEAIARYAPGEARHFVGELTKALGGAETVATPLVESLAGAGRVVVVWGERILGELGAATTLLELAQTLKLAKAEGAGLLEIPETANARGLREAGCLRDAGPGLSEVAVSGEATEEIPTALAFGKLSALVLFGVDPLRDFPGTRIWEEAITTADFVVCFSMHENATTAKADVVFPLETHAEKDGTVTHPDGRLQRVRPSAGRPGEVLPNIQVLAALSAALGHDTGIDSQPSAFAALKAAVPFYADVDDAELGGRGLRWQETPAAASAPRPQQGETIREAGIVGIPLSSGGDLLLGTYRDLWAGPITELNPPLRFLTPRQRLEVSPADAERLGLASGDPVRVARNGIGIEGVVQIKERVAEGVCFLAEGVAEGNANELLQAGPVRVEITKLSEIPA